MSRIYGIAEGGVITNIIVSDDLPDLEGAFDPPPDGPLAVIGWRWDGTAVSPPEPVLADLKAAKIASLRASCDAVIAAGFESAALGEIHHYPSGMIDQNNAMAAAIGGGLLWCAVGETWGQISHSASQAAQVVTDFSAYRSAASSRLAMLTADVGEATTADAVAALVWE